MAGTREVPGNAERLGKQRGKRRLHPSYEFHDVGQGSDRQLISGDKSTLSIRTPSRRGAGNSGDHNQTGTRKRTPT